MVMESFDCSLVRRSSRRNGPSVGHTNLGLMALIVVGATALISACGAEPVGNAPLAANPNITTPSAALLDVIAFAEGTNDKYNLIFSYKTFSSFADHPRRVVCSGGYCSDAAGRYQFLSTTWDETRRGAGLKSFEPAAQDSGALYRAESFRGVREHKVAQDRPGFERMIYKLNREWASLPGSPYGQPTKPMGSLWDIYQKSL